MFGGFGDVRLPQRAALWARYVTDEVLEHRIEFAVRDVYGIARFVGVFDTDRVGNESDCY